MIDLTAAETVDKWVNWQGLRADIVHIPTSGCLHIVLRKSSGEPIAQATLEPMDDAVELRPSMLDQRREKATVRTKSIRSHADAENPICDVLQTWVDALTWNRAIPAQREPGAES